jgi:Protein of unknown function (DUF1580)
MIDITKDEVLSLGQLARRLPKLQGNSVNISTCWRWAKLGVGGHKLETIRIGGRTFTTWTAYLAFAAAVAGGKATAPAPATPERARRRIRDAETVLRRAGIREAAAST